MLPLVPHWQHIRTSLIALLPLRPSRLRRVLHPSENTLILLHLHYRRGSSSSEEYRLLGYRATSNLDDKLAVSVLVRKLMWKYLRFFKYNLTIRRCSPTLQLQLLHTSVFLAPIDYLVSLLNIDSATV